MGEQIYQSGSPSGFQYDSNSSTQQNKYDLDNERKKKDDKDLVIEENTVYEIDRECYERLKRQRKRKVQEKRTV